MRELALPPPEGVSRDRAGAGRAAQDKASWEWLVPMGEEPGKKGFLALETSKKHEGERSARSGPGAGALPGARLRPAGHSSATSVNDDAEGGRPKTLGFLLVTFYKLGRSNARHHLESQ